MTIEGFQGRPLESGQSVSEEKVRFLPCFLLLDLGGVFLNSRYSVLFGGFSSLGIPVEKSSRIFSMPEYNDFVRGRIDSGAFCNGIREAIGEHTISDDEIRRIFDEHIIGVIPGMVALLERLTESYGPEKIIFCSDTNEWQTKRQEELLNLTRYRIITSNQLGLLKSDLDVNDGRNFFQIVIDELEVRPEELLFVDDNPFNIAVANISGIQTVRFEGREELETILIELGILESGQ